MLLTVCQVCPLDKIKTQFLRSLFSLTMAFFYIEVVVKRATHLFTPSSEVQIYFSRKMADWGQLHHQHSCDMSIFRSSSFMSWLVS